MPKLPFPHTAPSQIEEQKRIKDIQAAILPNVMEIIEDNDLLLFDDVPDKSRIAAQYFALDTVPGRMRAANLARSLTGGHYRLDFALASGLCMRRPLLSRFRKTCTTRTALQHSNYREVRHARPSSDIGNCSASVIKR